MEISLAVDKYWEDIMSGNSYDVNVVRDIASRVVEMVDAGTISVCEKDDSNASEWQINSWIRKAIVLYIKTSQSKLIVLQASDSSIAIGYDKVPLKFHSWTESDFINANIRVVPGAIVRHGVHIAPHCVVMPSFINIGACIGTGTMIDINVTIGSCAYVGERCHIGAGTTIGGVLEPFSEKPVIVEDNVFIGANCSVTDGVRIGTGAVLAAGVNISTSTKIYDAMSDMISYGYIPENAVVVSGAIQNTKQSYMSCALIAKYADMQTRERVGINELLR